MIIADCPACMAGSHVGHVSHWGKRPEGVIDGEFCYCSGDCAERARAAFDEFFGDMADVFAEGAPSLSPEAQRLIDGLRSTDRAIRLEAVREFNRLLAEDPLPDATTPFPSGSDGGVS